MGEYADMMLDGTCCSSCGELLGGPDDWADPAGYPRLCAACAEDLQIGKTWGCGKCSRQFKSRHALAQHTQDKHQKELRNG